MIKKKSSLLSIKLFPGCQFYTKNELEARVIEVYLIGRTAGLIGLLLTNEKCVILLIVLHTKGKGTGRVCCRNKNTGHPGRRFLAASPVCVFAFKLLKPPSYAGYQQAIVTIIMALL